MHSTQAINVPREGSGSQNIAAAALRVATEGAMERPQTKNDTIQPTESCAIGVSRVGSLDRSDKLGIPVRAFTITDFLRRAHEGSGPPPVIM